MTGYRGVQDITQLRIAIYFFNTAAISLDKFH